LENILLAFYQPPEGTVFKLKPLDWVKKIMSASKRED